MGSAAHLAAVLTRLHVLHAGKEPLFAKFVRGGE